MKVNQIISDNDNHMSIKGGIWVPKYSLTMSLFIEVSVLRKESERIDCFSVYTTD
jgi:hypothetical protein